VPPGRKKARVTGIRHDPTRPNKCSDAKQRSTRNSDLLNFGVGRITNEFPHGSGIDNRI
jgi:hypothetical protein